MSNDIENEFENARGKIERADKFAVVTTKEEFLAVVKVMSDIINMPETERQKLLEKIEQVFRDPALLSEIFPEHQFAAHFRDALKRVSNGPQN